MRFLGSWDLLGKALGPPGALGLKIDEKPWFVGPPWAPLLGLIFNEFVVFLHRYFRVFLKRVQDVIFHDF